MKIAVFSDIHGNLQALKAVLARIGEERADLTVFLGDIFQRGREETECLELLKDSGIICIKGNCELYVEHGVGIDPDVEYLRDYYDAMRKRLTEEQMHFIRQMPLFYEAQLQEHKLLFAHFLFLDLRSPYPFLQLSSLKDGSFDRARRREDVAKYELVVIGHAHRRFVAGNVVSVPAAGLGEASCLLIGEDRGKIYYRYISI